ncbi:CLM7 protein, partial [Atractosteus spatula]|nr:CLM7 protein [Atractosteus spatula]
MKYRNHVKYWCRGPSWIFCSILKKSITQQRDTDSLLISDNKSQHVFTVTMRGLKMDDEDWYWCAIEIQNAGDDGYALKLTITDGKSRPALLALNTLLLNIKSQSEELVLSKKLGSALLL